MQLPNENGKNISHKYECHIQVLIAGTKYKYQMHVPNIYVKYIGKNLNYHIGLKCKMIVYNKRT